MYRLLKVFLLIESIAGISLLSIYSTSGLLKESQVDIDSFKETDRPSDLLGETSMLYGVEIAATAGKIPSFRGTEVTLQASIVLDFTFEGAGKEPVLVFEAGGPFLTLAILFEHGACTYKILLISNYFFEYWNKFSSIKNRNHLALAT